MILDFALPQTLHPEVDRTDSPSSVEGPHPEEIRAPTVQKAAQPLVLLSPRPEHFNLDAKSEVRPRLKAMTTIVLVFLASS